MCCLKIHLASCAIFKIYVLNTDKRFNDFTKIEDNVNYNIYMYFLKSK